MDIHKTKLLFGDYDQNLILIQNEFNVDIILRDDKLRIIGEEENVSMANKVVKLLMDKLDSEGVISSHAVDYAIRMVRDGDDRKTGDLSEVIITTARGKVIRAKTLGQRRYIDSIKRNEVVFAIGPAGTGKTYLAMAMAIKAFKNKEVNRIILTRPAVEAGEKLGFLPGDLQDKVDPYLRPLYDALYDIMGVENFQRNMEKGLIEVAPLAYMRGRTLDDSYIILDEAQNTTPEQMKMFLTRLGFGSKAIITGDVTQIDLPRGKFSGLKQVEEILKNINGIEFIHLGEKDVVRHKLVQYIIKAYEKYEEENISETDLFD
ncbi:MAG: PhoH family protein [Lutispora sp.]|uniref:PhoH family protein n=1 Tax=Lutispora sp. TaxID=2828727 RepID=UPI0035614975